MDAEPKNRAHAGYLVSESRQTVAEQWLAPTPTTGLPFAQSFWAHDDLMSVKWVRHLPVYQDEISRIAHGRPVRLLEVGVENGGSLQVWAKVLPKGSEVIGIDIDPRCGALPVGHGARVVVGDARDPNTVAELVGASLFDVIVDDGSHVASDVIAAFRACFPRLSPGGVYIIEDLRASYSSAHGGGLQRPGSAMEFLKSLADAVNADHFEETTAAANADILELRQLGAWIDCVVFHDSMVAVRKSAVRRRPHARAVAGRKSPVSSVLDAILSTPAAQVPDVAAGLAAVHSLDMEMLEEVRRRRAEASVLEERERTSRFRYEAIRQDLGYARRALAAAREEAEAARGALAEIQSSGFWRLTAPPRHILQRYPALHRASRGVLRTGYKAVQRLLPRPAVEGAPAAGGGAAAADPPSVFDAHHALRAESIPADADLTVLVPFESELPPAPLPRIAVMIHAYYIAEFEWIIERARDIPGGPDLLVTTDTEAKRAVFENALAGWKGGRVAVRIAPNRGRDIAPKLSTLADVYDGYDLVLHLHTKRSPHSARGDAWFRHILTTLAGSPSVVRSVLAAFAAQPRLGIVYADHWGPIRGLLNWGLDYPDAQKLAQRMGFGLSREEPLEFPSGSMFWARPAALKPLLDLRLQPDEFPEESGQTDGTLAHAIERLFLRVCEHAGYSWIRVAHDELFQGDRHRAVRIGSLETLRAVLGRHRALLSDPALRASSRILPDATETWPLRIAPDFDAKPRVNLLIPTLRRESVFGGIATAYALFTRVADALGTDFERRIVLTTEYRDIERSDLPDGWSLVGPADGGGDREVVNVPPASRLEHGLPVQRHDIFFASAWWDAASGFGLIESQHAFSGGKHRLRYFVQDYEPNFSAWSSSWAMAEATYHRPEETVALVNSTFLAEHLDQLGLRFPRRFVFKPLWNRGLGEPDDRPAGRENILVVYWRPHVERNLGPIAAAGLRRWLEQDPYVGRDWQIVGVGQDGAEVQLTDWRTMTVKGKLKLSDYRALLRRAKVGLALMLSPHPSYPPLEMAAFGMRVVTNDFGAKDLSALGSRVESISALTPQAVGDALHRAVASWEGDTPDTGDFAFDEAFSTEAELERIALAVAEGIRSEIT